MTHADEKGSIVATIYIERPHGSSLTRTFAVAKTAASTGYHRGEKRYEHRVDLSGAVTTIEGEVERIQKVSPLSVTSRLNVVTVTLEGDLWNEELEEAIAQVIKVHLNITERVDVHRKY